MRIFRLGRRAASAIEYLMANGWMIVVLVVVSFTFWQLGIFNLGSAAYTASGFSGLRPIMASVESLQLENGFKLDAIFTNTLKTKIRIKQIVIDNLGSDSDDDYNYCAVRITNRDTDWVYFRGFNETENQTLDISPGENLLLEAVTDCKYWSTGGPPPPQEEREYSLIRVVINYDVLFGSQQISGKSSVGSIQGENIGDHSGFNYGEYWCEDILGCSWNDVDRKCQNPCRPPS
ncbi:hypothetical protein ACFLRC_03905 [Candidatus Altiarchaeota archaeon]